MWLCVDKYKMLRSDDFKVVSPCNMLFQLPGVLMSCLLIIGTSSALTCKSCLIQNCGTPSNEECLDPGETQQTACLSQSFRREGSNQTEIQMQKKCVLFEKDSVYECVDHPGYLLLTCDVCKTDFCNEKHTLNGTIYKIE